MGKSTSPEAIPQSGPPDDIASTPATADSPATAKLADDDWGIAPPRSGISRETKLGFAFVFVLLVVFGFVVYKKIERNRIEKGDLLAGVQKDGQVEKPQEPPVAPTTNAQTPFAESSAPPVQSGDPFSQSQPIAQHEPMEPTPASWDNQTFEPTPAASSAASSNEPFPPGPPEEFTANESIPPAQPFPASEPAQSTAATQVEEFNPTPFPEAEVSQTPPAAPQGFEPPEEFGNPAQLPAESTAQSPPEQADPGANPFGSAGEVTQVPPTQAPMGLENEQFSTQSEPQEVVQQPVPSPMGETSVSPIPAEQNLEPTPQELPTAQVAPAPTGGDPFGSAPSEMPSTQPMPMPQEVAAENDPRFGDFQPLPANAQYEANPRGVPNELPSDAFSEMSSSQICTVGGTGHGQMQPTDRPEVYTVRPGDNYWHISKKQYGTVRYFMALARYNQERIPDPKKMRPGMKVLTPTRDILESRNPDLFPKFAANTTGVHNVAHQGGEAAGFYVDAQGTPMYRVGPDDTLGGIAQKHLGRFSRWVEIYQMNRHRLKNPDALSLGDVLQLPADASRVSMVRHASAIR